MLLGLLSTACSSPYSPSGTAAAPPAEATDVLPNGGVSQGLLWSGESNPTLAGTAGAARPTAGAARPIGGPILPRESLVAEAVVPRIAIHVDPADDPSIVLEHPQPSGAPLVFLVIEERDGWLNVLLPVRPNGSAGWIRRSDVSLSRHNFQIVVELERHEISVYDGAEVLHRESIGVGRAAAPTPGGLYYTKELIRPVNEQGVDQGGGPYGPFAYGLSGFSEVYTEFGGGDGALGIHGTNNPSSLGGDVSSGCIRMSNDGITKLAGILPLGVPVEVRA